jgi:hypothetical protein
MTDTETPIQEDDTKFLNGQSQFIDVVIKRLTDPENVRSFGFVDNHYEARSKSMIETMADTYGYDFMRDITHREMQYSQSTQWKLIEAVTNIAVSMQSKSQEIAGGIGQQIREWFSNG